MVRSAFDIDSYINRTYNTDESRNTYGISSEYILIGKISRLSILKGHSFLIQALKKVIHEIPNARLLLVGNGELEENLKHSVKQMGLSDYVFFSGLISPPEIPKIIKIMHIVVHTSLLEGLAKVIPQAIMLEKPVISFDLDGSPEVIENNYNGYLVEPKNIDELADKIIDLC